VPLNCVTLLYRGLLGSCNYTCGYCPFAGRHASSTDLRADRDQLLHFVHWIAGHTIRKWSVFFTPRGEALIHSWYRDAVVQLAGLSHVAKVAVQTNLSLSRLDWLASCPPQKIGLWCTYHPGQVARSAFLRRCRALDDLGVSYSVGCVGLYEHLEEIERLRREMRREVYLWINAFKHSPSYYDDSTIRRIEQVDPLFRFNLENHVCRGRLCRCGSTIFSVSGDGTLRRCHFVEEVLGNLYEDGLESRARPDPCSQPTCRCHIGYVHLEHLGLSDMFKEGILERVVAFPFTARDVHPRWQSCTA
jgi:MoaA/NifB/PqqE/SkfB family radical SAM enzyme